MRISVDWLTRVLVWITIFLVGIHLIVLFLSLGLGLPQAEKLAKLFHLNGEQTIPAYYSTFLLLLSAILLLMIGNLTHGERLSTKWKWLSVIFLALSIDEMVALHERLIPVVRSLIGVNPYFYWGWVIPAAVALALFGLVFFKFWRSLPPETARGMMWAGIVFISGALGLEFFEGMLFFRVRNYGDLWLQSLFLLEESMEMLGIIMFIRTLLKYMKNHLSLIEIRIE
ncbi:hypothetical protein [Fulvivirga sedimenti]|uniref:Uncharacterized protein n=1 Tax=Fulvivirga sedimenti TaxID=2879465 RepID=A0A9X1HQ61_9BACT|nr:hypothetical protein [Fulvivirga sedimenti]MCA6074182.1 hypothetical protein [Fulvivirga sedimenti]